MQLDLADHRQHDEGDGLVDQQLLTGAVGTDRVRRACAEADRLVAEIESAHGQPSAEDIAWAEAVADRVEAALAGRPD